MKKVKCAHRQWFLKVFESSNRDFHNRIMPVFYAVPPEGLKITSIRYWVLIGSLAHNVSRFSKSFDLIYCRWWNILSLHNFILRNNILKLFRNLLMQFSAESLPSFTSLRCFLYAQSCYWPIENSNWLQHVPSCLFLVPLSFPTFFSFWTPVWTFLRCVAAIKFKTNLYFLFKKFLLLKIYGLLFVCK